MKPGDTIRTGATAGRSTAGTVTHQLARAAGENRYAVTLCGVRIFTPISPADGPPTCPRCVDRNTRPTPPNRYDRRRHEAPA